jgi:hypothetical protein
VFDVVELQRLAGCCQLAQAGGHRSGGLNADALRLHPVKILVSVVFPARNEGTGILVRLGRQRGCHGCPAKRRRPHVASIVGGSTLPGVLSDRPAFGPVRWGRCQLSGPCPSTWAAACYQRLLVLSSLQRLDVTCLLHLGLHG